MDLEEVSQQSLRLTRIMLLLVFGVAFYWLWSDLVAVSPTSTAWCCGTSSARGPGPTPCSSHQPERRADRPLCVWCLCRWPQPAGPAGGAGALQAAPCQGTAYAFTTMLNYALIGGRPDGAGHAGGPVGKLQVAGRRSVGRYRFRHEARSSPTSSPGIIILFERPVRIGDTVTIGTISGTVNKIRIRSTTLTDFDRKEVIIPNQQLMIERLINWSCLTPSPGSSPGSGWPMARIWI